MVLGEAMEKALRECCRSVRIGKMLMVRDEDTGERHVSWQWSDVSKVSICLLSRAVVRGFQCLVSDAIKLGISQIIKVLLGWNCLPIVIVKPLKR